MAKKTKTQRRSLSEITFFTFATVLVLTLTFNFAFNNKGLQKPEILGEEDELDLDFDSFESELDNSLEELDVLIEKEIETKIEDIEEENQELEIESEYLGTKKKVQLDSQGNSIRTNSNEANTTQTRKTSQIQKLFLLLPVEIETEQEISNSGEVVSERKTFLGKLLDLFSF